MAIPSRQIGWSTESNLLWQILKQLTRLTSTLFSLKEAATPKYKVYTALLTQSGGDNILPINTGDLTIGVTYLINDSSVGMDFTNVGAPNNDSGTYFVATGTTPNSWGIDEGGPGILLYNTGAPVVTVLENTIGNIWFTYQDVGNYIVNSNGLFTANKTIPQMLPEGYTEDSENIYSYECFPTDTNSIGIRTLSKSVSTDNLLGAYAQNAIEIKVYN